MKWEKADTLKEFIKAFLSGSKSIVYQNTTHGKRKVTVPYDFTTDLTGILQIHISKRRNIFIILAVMKHEDTFSIFVQPHRKLYMRMFSHLTETPYSCDLCPNKRNCTVYIKKLVTANPMSLCCPDPVVDVPTARGKLHQAESDIFPLPTNLEEYISAYYTNCTPSKIINWAKQQLNTWQQIHK